MRTARFALLIASALMHGCSAEVGTIVHELEGKPATVANAERGIPSVEQAASAHANDDLAAAPEGDVDHPAQLPQYERYELPISDDYNQRSTKLCWAYAMLNTLESHYLARHPGRTIGLSRNAFRYWNWRDRFLSYIDQSHVYLKEVGTSINAIDLIRENGVIAFQDYPDVGSFDDDEIGMRVDAAPTKKAKRKALERALDEVSSMAGRPPEWTTFEGRRIRSKKLAEIVVGDDEWESFAPDDEAPEHYGLHPDEDARPGTIAHFMPKERVIKMIHDALAAGVPVAYSMGWHSIEIYGGEFLQGVPQAYFVKDSAYGIHTESADSVHGNLFAITTLKHLPRRRPQ